MTEFTTENSRWEAVLAHDSAADGQFWYGVKSTGIYCRPACPSRRPKRENVLFFDSPQQAQVAGFRACKRCQPERVNAAAQAVAHVQHLLDTAETEPTLTELARAVGFSPFHLQRVFKASVGVSPKGYAMQLKREKLKAGLKAGQSVTAALYGAGHDSPATVYAKKTGGLGMTPRRYALGGENMTIHYTITPSTLGPMLVAATERGLCSVQFGNEPELRAALTTEFPNAERIEDAAPLQEYISGLHAYLAGQNPALNLSTDAQGTEFQQRVWDALRRIPYGETRSYAQLAEMIGEKGAVRAVATACARNPVALVVPCHRIVRTGGEPGGYRWGVERKKKLLDAETAGKQPLLF